MFDKLVFASNRGPIDFSRAGGRRKAPGGVAPVLGAAIRGRPAVWIAAAPGAGAIKPEVIDGIKVCPVAIDPPRYAGAYGRIANQTLWFAHHGLWDAGLSPVFDAAAHRAWDDYRWFDGRFARALSSEGGDRAAFLIQDYHLSLTPAMLRELRPNAAIAHFSHTPFADPETFAHLPERWRTELIRGLLGADVLGFHSEAWADRFMACAARVPGVEVDPSRQLLRTGDRKIRVGIFPVAVDAGRLLEEAPASTPPRREELATILRVDRLDPAKNIIRGFLALEEFLSTHPRWMTRVRFIALLNPSRSELPEYRRYARMVRQEVGRINARLSVRGWSPIELKIRDDRATALRAFATYDVLMVNAISDGMNLVCMEGPVLNQRDGAVILSERTGAFALLGEHAIPVDPFDVSATARAIGTALNMPRRERAGRAAALRRTAQARSPRDWLDEQLEALTRARAKG